MIHILFLTSLYSTPSQPWRSPPNARIAHAMKRHARMKVVAPLPYYPERLARGRADLEAIVRVPPIELDTDGSEVLHPRYLHVPKVGRTLYPWLYAGSVLDVLSREIVEFRPSVIMSAWAYPDGVAAVALAKLLGVPSMLRVMGSDVNSFGKERGRRFQIAWALRNVDRIVCVSEALADVCVELGASRDAIDVIPTGVDGNAFFPVDRDEARAELGLPESARIIVSPARLSREKGVRYFVEALARLEDPSVVGVLVGDGPEEPMLRSLVGELGLEGRVIFAGYRREHEMRSFYSAADLVCLPSLEEGWPNVLIESFACGCPWVASDVGGVAEVARIADAGLLAQAGDSADLARALEEGLARSWDRYTISARGRSLAIEETGRQYVEACKLAAGIDKRGVTNASSPRDLGRSESWIERLTSSFSRAPKVAA